MFYTDYRIGLLERLTNWHDKKYEFHNHKITRSFLATVQWKR